jgi:hypothetical protein
MNGKMQNGDHAEKRRERSVEPAGRDSWEPQAISIPFELNKTPES